MTCNTCKQMEEPNEAKPSISLDPGILVSKLVVQADEFSVLKVQCMYKVQMYSYDLQAWQAWQ